MPQPIIFPAQNHIRKLEALRNSRVLVFAASHLEIEILPALYEQLCEISRVERLDVVIQCRGGVVNGARRIILLLRQFTDHLGLIVPHYCESSSTILSLAANEIVAGELAIFSPIDPHLNGSSGSGDNAVSTFSCLDIKMFGKMSQDWFGIHSDEARIESLSLLCQSIFPPALTAFYRTALELEQIGTELLKYQLPEQSEEYRQQIIRQLMYGYHSHNYAITRDEMAALGLKLRRDPETEQLAWEMSRMLHTIVGGGLRQSLEEPWYDVLLASRDSVKVRQKQNDGFVPQWIEADFAA
ncbi:MAG: hypothetical protein AB1489_06725 [Acidobacteriota bacterium]